MVCPKVLKRVRFRFGGSIERNLASFQTSNQPRRGWDDVISLIRSFSLDSCCRQGQAVRGPPEGHRGAHRHLPAAVHVHRLCHLAAGHWQPHHQAAPGNQHRLVRLRHHPFHAAALLRAGWQRRRGLLPPLSVSINSDPKHILNPIF